MFIFPTYCGSAGKESACNVRDLGLISELGRSQGEGKGYPLQYSSLENSVDSRVNGAAKSWTHVNDFHFQAHLNVDAVHWQNSPHLAFY